MERDMLSMALSDLQKGERRDRWRQKETEYLREQRRKVDISAFVKLKNCRSRESTAFMIVIKHPSCLTGAFSVVSLFEKEQLESSSP
ncbi:hypothetical protein EI94DRAFT_1735770 [Lactarius quietus]|nr:hypothetical protein EI94DRAFT_1735770 [Lactarius quietus]